MTQPYVISGVPGYIYWMNHFTYLHVDMDISSDAIIKCNPIFLDIEVDDAPFYLPWH